VIGEISESVADLDLESFDLILIDDSKTSTQRSATIRAVAAKQPQRPLIAIHDFEIDEYRDAASGFKHRHRFRAYNPETGVLANRSLDLRSLNRSLKQNAKTLEPDNIKAWSNTIL